MPDNYLDLLTPALRKPGDHRRGEIEILPPEGAGDFGVLYEDRYILLVRDRVRFPDGQEGGYIRIINRSELANGPGTVMVPIWKNEIVFIRIFRHATREWEWELPRGFQEPGVTEQENAEKEIIEELGIAPSGMRRLGAFNANTGLTTGLIGAYAVELAADPATAGRPAKHEGISRFRSVPPGALADFAATGGIRCGISLAALFLYLNRQQ